MKYPNAAAILVFYNHPQPVDLEVDHTMYKLRYSIEWKHCNYIFLGSMSFKKKKRLIKLLNVLILSISFNLLYLS